MDLNGAILGVGDKSHSSAARMSLRSSLIVKLKFKSANPGSVCIRNFNLNFQLLRLRFMRTHARERRPNPGMLAKINRALARHAPWFPNFLLSQFHLFLRCLGTIRTNLTTDFTDTISIKDKSLIPGFPIFSFPHFIFSRHRPDLQLKLKLPTSTRVSRVN